MVDGRSLWNSSELNSSMSLGVVKRFLGEDELLICPILVSISEETNASNIAWARFVIKYLNKTCLTGQSSTTKNVHLKTSGFFCSSHTVEDDCPLQKAFNDDITTRRSLMQSNRTVDFSQFRLSIYPACMYVCPVNNRLQWKIHEVIKSTISEPAGFTWVLVWQSLPDKVWVEIMSCDFNTMLSTLTSSRSQLFHGNYVNSILTKCWSWKHNNLLQIPNSYII